MSKIICPLLLVAVVIKFAAIVEAAVNIAQGKTAWSDSEGCPCCAPTLATDGILGGNMCKCFSNNKARGWLQVDLAAPFNIDYMTVYPDAAWYSHMDQFISGGSNLLTARQKGTYYVCNQCEYNYALAWDTCTTKCSANIPAVRYVVLQQKSDLDTGLSACELLVYAAPDPKKTKWTRFSNRRLLAASASSFNKSSTVSCLYKCIQLSCDSVNYNKLLKTCEVLKHPFGVLTGNIPAPSPGWDHWKLFYA
ncbi:hypothetical protein HELRODRAFT_182148 [Helobdella robusta]|uniref:Apple domain-containing protein n=1 Tax=Helobdella robusta TaxID=6412 RepID=T1FHU0_HELRO|nr:hypothetical protein HELRODRAFT_182148 [Helobdella robusta]ESN91176.1 hypothetical protein HELRODRAFT_182148 [Helobdella robusta]